MQRAIQYFTGAGLPEEPNINQEVFNPKDERHLKYIEKSLNNFASKRDTLLSFDLKLLALGGVDCLGIFSGSWGMLIAAVAGAGLYLYSKSSGHDEMQHEFDQSLDDLYQLYCWCARQNGRSINDVTSNDSFLKLLSAIIPFTLNWQKLLPWEKLETIKPDDFSNRMHEIFAQSPHKLPLHLQKPAAVEPQRSAQVVVLPVPDVGKMVYGSRPYSFFAESTANAKLKWYGHTFEKVAGDAPRPK